jgi:hypothetical protein
MVTWMHVHVRAVRHRRSGPAKAVACSQLVEQLSTPDFTVT